VNSPRQQGLFSAIGTLNSFVSKICLAGAESSRGNRNGATSIRFSTVRTPGALQAARSASSRSKYEWTSRGVITLSPSTSTLIRLASNSALRFSADSISALLQPC